MISALKVETAGWSDVGLVRTSNQDSFASDDELGLYVVCDGMGGALGGDVASKLAVKTFLDVARQELEGRRRTLPGSTYTALQRAANAANRAVYAQASWDIALRGMGTTLVGARLDGESLTIVNVGDSRAYLCHGGHLLQLTQDHSYLDEQVRAGRMTPRQAERSNLQSVITRAVGSEPDVVPDLYETVLQSGDTLLLTSDGLTRHVKDTELTAVLGSSSPPDDICSQLIALAKKRGGSDNITCIVVRLLAV